MLDFKGIYLLLYRKHFCTWWPAAIKLQNLFVGSNRPILSASVRSGTESVHLSVKYSSKSILFVSERNVWAVKVGGNDTHLSGIQVMRHLQHQEENTQGLLLDGVSLPGFHDLPAQRQEWMNLLQLTLHQQQLQTQRVIQQHFHTGHMTRKAIQASICWCTVERVNTDTHHAFAQQEERSVKTKFNQLHVAEIKHPRLKCMWCSESHLVYSDPTTLAYSAPTPSRSQADTRSFSSVWSCCRETNTLELLEWRRSRLTKKDRLVWDSSAHIFTTFIRLASGVLKLFVSMMQTILHQCSKRA